MGNCFFFHPISRVITLVLITNNWYSPAFEESDCGFGILSEFLSATTLCTTPHQGKFCKKWPPPPKVCEHTSWATKTTLLPSINYTWLYNTDPYNGLNFYGINRSASIPNSSHGSIKGNEVIWLLSSTVPFILGLLLSSTLKAKCPIFKVIVAGFRGKVA